MQHRQDNTTVTGTASNEELPTRANYKKKEINSLHLKIVLQNQ